MMSRRSTPPLARPSTRAQRRGPTLIEAMTMRMLGHAIHDTAEYVPRELLATWEARDPVARFREKLVAEGVSAGDLDAVAGAAMRRWRKRLRSQKAARGPIREP